ncbi:hypothetical protein BKA67DRAFT_587282 [Truncatella angustata]|uniref:Uncharacterized protein n=1 Tax=Truncatella angustata TaxID=152316 RepID=A0A9P8RHZ4_9PEZI|nr:uncharacterized protein BKA67DRAFT_587282 [Truncatella angustata]KAH6643267.1 hypothetical protein BKA67DRAFT_587282 [Truncatella angustata]
MQLIMICCNVATDHAKGNVNACLHAHGRNTWGRRHSPRLEETSDWERSPALPPWSLDYRGRNNPCGNMV